jgi:hypothetical protein
VYFGLCLLRFLEIYIIYRKKKKDQRMIYTNTFARSIFYTSNETKWVSFCVGMGKPLEDAFHSWLLFEWGEILYIVYVLT